MVPMDLLGYVRPECVCKLKDYIEHREIEERLYKHYSQANYILMLDTPADGTMLNSLQ